MRYCTYLLWDLASFSWLNVSNKFKDAEGIQNTSEMYMGQLRRYTELVIFVLGGGSIPQAGALQQTPCLYSGHTYYQKKHACEILNNLIRKIGEQKIILKTL